MTLDLKTLDPRVLEPLAGSKAVNADDHFVELYDDDVALMSSVRTFVTVGINEGEAAVVIATPAHREAIERELGRTLDVQAAREQGLFQTRDAAETLALFMGDGRPDPVKFDRVIGDVLADAARGGRRVRVFGEMVAVLWAEGNVAAALALEDHWNRLGRSQRFRLFCAYPTEAFAADDTSSLSGVCNRHSHVVLTPR